MSERTNTLPALTLPELTWLSEAVDLRLRYLDAIGQSMEPGPRRDAIAHKIAMGYSLSTAVLEAAMPLRPARCSHCGCHVAAPGGAGECECECHGDG
jgi:hypothetical protein